MAVWLYTGDVDATPEMIAAAYDAAGAFYIGNAGLAHEALGGVDGELADSVATVLVWIEGEALHSMVVESTPDLPSGVVYLPGGTDDLPTEYLAGPNVPPVQVIPANQAVLVAIRDYWRTIAASARLVDSFDHSGSETPIPEGHSRAYRAVSEAEYQDIIASGQLRQGPNSMEGKWFADSLEGVHLHSDALHGPGNYRIMEVDIPDDAPSLFQDPNLAGFGPARYLDIDDLPDVITRPMGIQE